MIIIIIICSDGQKAEAGKNDVHAHTARHSRIALWQNSLPGHIYERGGGTEDQPSRVQSSGTCNH